MFPLKQIPKPTLHSCRLILGQLELLGHVQQNMWRRGDIRMCLFVSKRRNLSSEKIVPIFSLHQTQSRSRDCNVAQNGGSTAVCTSSETATRSCNNNACRKFFFLLMFRVVATPVPNTKSNPIQSNGLFLRLSRALF